MLKNHILLIIGITWLCNALHAQDPMFLLYNNAPMQTNPALTGLSKVAKLNLNYQNRWASIDNGFNTINAEFSKFFKKSQSGLGLSLMSDHAGGAGYTHTQVGLYYAYELRFSKKSYIRTGFEGKIANHSINTSNLTVYNQLSFDGNSGSGLSIPQNSQTYADAGLGIIAQTPYLYAGLSLHHVNNIRLSLYKNALDNSDRLPTRISFQLGSSIDLKPNKARDFVLLPSFLFSKQGNFNLVQTDLQLLYKFFLTGIALRHTISTSDAVIVSAGFQKGIFKLMYAYGVDLSPLANYSGGTHELSMCFNWELAKEYKENRYNDCLEIFR